MLQLTKKAIIDSFVQLLNQRPLDQITVTDIARECGISRRTFYHYYQDIYQLPEDLFLSETRKILKGETDFRSWEQWFEKMTVFAFHNKTAIAHIYHSARREYLERYIFTIADKTFTDFIAQSGKSKSYRQEDIDMLAAFYTSAAVGLAFDWIRRGMQENPQQLIHGYVKLLKGTVQRALDNCEQSGTEEAAQP
mgnify:FL=1